MRYTDLLTSNYEITRTSSLLVEASKLPPGKERMSLLIGAYVTLSWIVGVDGQAGSKEHTFFNLKIEDDDHDQTSIEVIGSNKESNKMCLRLTSSLRISNNRLTSAEAKQLALALLRALEANDVSASTG